MTWRLRTLFPAIGSRNEDIYPTFYATKYPSIFRVSQGFLRSPRHFKKGESPGDEVARWVPLIQWRGAISTPLIYSVFIGRHGGHIGVSKQRNGVRVCVCVYQTNPPRIELYFYTKHMFSFVSVNQYGRWSREWKCSTQWKLVNPIFMIASADKFVDITLSAKFS